MTWVNSGGAVSGGPTVTGPYASAADLQALKTDGGQGGSVLVTATGSSTTHTLADWTALIGSGGVGDATGATKGILRLAGQLGGTATSPTVTGLTGAIVGPANINATGTPSASTYFRGDGTWSTPAGGGGGLSGLADGTTAAGVDPTGATDSTTGIQNVLTANAGKAVWFGPGTYLVSSVISVPDGTAVLGVGNESDPTQGGTTFVSAQANFSFFSCANRCVFSGLNFDKSGSPTITSGSIIEITGIAVRVENVYADVAYGGIVVKPAASGQSGGHHFKGVAIKNVVDGGSALDFDGSAASGNVDAITVTDFILTGAINGTTTSTMIRLRGHAEGIVFINGITVGGGYSLQTSSRSWAMSERPAHNNFTNVHFDASRFGTVLTDTFNISFTSCWFSTGMAGGGSGSGSSHGMLLNQSDMTTITACVFANSYAYGFASNASAVRVRIVNSAALSNNGGAVGAHGFSFSANQTDFVVQGSVATNVTGFTGTQGYGIVVNGGTSDRYIIADNLVSGNATGGVSDGGSGVNKRVANNY